ncbi:bifunctional DNA-formamidopyrimidine glycosylase/DNA-(apurinic or apyrimidinic site) lyase [Desulfoplanes sp. PS50]
MPELPEVETIAKGLACLVTGRVVDKVDLRYPGIVLGGTPGSWAKRLAGKTIHQVHRRGKLLIFTLSDGLFVVFHLKMTGRVWIVPRTFSLTRHDHLVLHLLDGDRIVFNDQRKFGYAGVFTARELAQWPFYQNLGPEPLSLDFEAFEKIIHATRARIKAVLLDQQRIAGIGNIYADETLFRAGIHPCSRSNGLADAQVETLLEALKGVLVEAIAAGGSSIRDYRDAHGEHGLFQVRLSVYGRRGLPCPRCGKTLVSLKVAGRTSTLCPSCQKCFGTIRESA